MSLKSQFKGLAIGAFLSEPARRARTEARHLVRRARREKPRVEFYYQADDPYSHLLAQLVPELAERYPVDWSFYLVPEPAADVDPAPEQRRVHAMRDAHELTRYFELDFPVVKKPPEPKPVNRAAAVLTMPRPFEEQIAAARDVGDALWSGDKKALELARGRHRFEASGNVEPHAHTNYARLRKRGHYHGGTLYYRGEWYWGIDRLHYLEERLREDTGRTDEPSVLRLRPDSERPSDELPTDDDGLVPLRFFFSFRSPYSYLAVDRVLRLAERYPVRLEYRPVQPMVSRGLQVPRQKQLYIVEDAKREADRLGMPFGRLCDPLGRGVDNCLALFHHAERTGRAADLLQSLTRGIWSEALDVTEYVDLRRAVERAGIDWADAVAALSDDAWRDRVDANVGELQAIGLWGVPSFQLGDYAAWGQDRLFLIEDKLRAHTAARDAA